MANRHRGEVSATLDGRRWTLVLTLGALAELEDAFGVEDLAALADRFGSGRLSARDLSRIIGAGLRGAGHDVTDDEVGQMRAEGGVQALAGLVSTLLQVTFAGPDAETGAPTEAAGQQEAADPEPCENPSGPRAGHRSRPFPGTM
ncbi:gene transfer agent family protein [Stappia taiwanensis]|uniref:Gene transfer agent family protein n=1 Tax=Stappia taiwanensis TaxID=992267 RepID=A0A838XV29_9HYPH|nr:gene transfer agent family protein [Stappia taiwanensis]MBA4610924.1 gene transfer agent family protein [Stappia taiwanensis]GGE94793.1 hypothetical protein GCM10007285_23050 [Stappia taiwanensis]